MKKILKSAIKPQNPHRVVAVIGMIFVFSVIPLTAISVGLLIQSEGTQSRAAGAVVPLVDKKDAVVIAERKVCSLVGANQTAVKIVGEDGGASAKLGANSFFTFGDTNLNIGGQIPNSSASTTDSEASDCLEMTSKSANGTAVPTLPKVAGECTVWPTDLVNAPDGKIHFFFVSLGSSCQIQHIGLAEMNTTNMDSVRTIPVFFSRQDSQIPNYRILGASLTRQGNDVFVFFGGERVSDNKEVVLLAKVSASEITNKGAYTYWNGSSFQANPAAMVPLWDQGSIGTNGMTIRFNQYLNKWTAIYNTGYVSVMSMRTADSVTGPWGGEQVLINCLEHFPLGSNPNSYPCYGAKEYPHFQKNSGQTIYVVQSNTDEYKPFLHEIVFGKAIHQLTNGAGISILRQQGDVPAGFVDDGVAFYASDTQILDFRPIKEWVKDQDVLYSDLGFSGYQDNGIKFYAPRTKKFLTTPISGWVKDGNRRYSALDLSSYGYSSFTPSIFYATVTNYRVRDEKLFPRRASNFQIGVKKDGNWVQGGRVKSVKFSGLTPGTKYSPIINTPLLPNRYLGQNIPADSSGNLSVNADLQFVSFANLALFGENQALNTTTNTYGYEVKAGSVLAPEIGHQINPFRRAGNFKNFYLTAGTSTSEYDVRACNTECAGGGVVWAGKAPKCDDDLTVTPTGATKCAKLKEVTLGGFTANTQYEVYYCAPNCENSVASVIYERQSDGSGNIYLTEQPLSTPTPTPTPTPLPLGKFKTEYFNNSDFTNKVLEREEDKASIGFGGVVGKVPVSELTADGQYSIRWEGRFNLPAGKYRVNTSAGPDSAKVFVDGSQIQEGTAIQNALVNLTAGEHTLKFEFIKTKADRPYNFLSNYVERTTCFDLTGDFKINSVDQGTLATKINKNGESAWDLNGDSMVNSGDQLLLSQRFNQTCPHSIVDTSPQSCTVSPTSVNRGVSIRVAIGNGTADNLEVSLLEQTGQLEFPLGTINGRVGDFVIGESVQLGVYYVKLNKLEGLLCSPTLTITQ